MPKKRKPAFDATIRFRWYKTLAKRIERIVERRGRGEDESDFLREGTARFIEDEEKRLGLPALTVAEEPPAYGTKTRVLQIKASSGKPARRRKPQTRRRK